MIICMKKRWTTKGWTFAQPNLETWESFGMGTEAPVRTTDLCNKICVSKSATAHLVMKLNTAHV